MGGDDDFKLWNMQKLAKGDGGVRVILVLKHGYEKLGFHFVKGLGAAQAVARPLSTWGGTKGRGRAPAPLVAA